jgi:hypothetical protein
VFILSTASATWHNAKKTKGLRAKHMSALLGDISVMSKFLVDTLEAREPVSGTSMFCIGEAGDAWQQTAKKLLAKYDIIDIDAQGWLECRPKPENMVEFFEVTAEMLAGEKSGYVVGMWGEVVDGVKNLQAFTVGDMVARNPTDTADQWVVRRRIWDNSYSVI